MGGDFSDWHEIEHKIVQLAKIINGVEAVLLINANIFYVVVPVNLNEIETYSSPT